MRSFGARIYSLLRCFGCFFFDVGDNSVRPCVTQPGYFFFGRSCLFRVYVVLAQDVRNGIEKSRQENAQLQHKHHVARD